MNAQRATSATLTILLGGLLIAGMEFVAGMPQVGSAVNFFGSYPTASEAGALLLTLLWAGVVVGVLYGLLQVIVVGADTLKAWQADRRRDFALGTAGFAVAVACLLTTHPAAQMRPATIHQLLVAQHQMQRGYPS